MDPDEESLEAMAAALELEATPEQQPEAEDDVDALAAELGIAPDAKPKPVRVHVSAGPDSAW